MTERNDRCIEPRPQNLGIPCPGLSRENKACFTPSIRQGHDDGQPGPSCLLGHLLKPRLQGIEMDQLAKNFHRACLTSGESQKAPRAVIPQPH